MLSNRQQILIVFTVIVLLVSRVSSSNSRPPRNNDISNMADALKYLQDLDTYYGDRARIRFGKRASLIQLLRNHLAKEEQLGRPSDLDAAEEPF